jgi:hypothetical protein
MYIDKKTLLTMLDKEDIKYKDNKLIINLLPKNSYFELCDEDTLTAMYYNEKDEEILSFKLSFDHLNQNKINYISEKMDMDSEINEYMNLELYNSNKKVKYNIIPLFIFYLILFLSVSYLIYIIYLNLR